MIININKKIEEIFEKEFKTAVRGYKKKEVDIFLDELSETLEHVANSIKEQKQTNDNILKENLALKSAVIKMEKKLREQDKNRELDELVLEKKLNQMEEQLKMLRKENF
ncbi:MAG: DivIVA domain-containing protein [Mycoplasmatales bacterium]